MPPHRARAFLCSLVSLCVRKGPAQRKATLTSPHLRPLPWPTHTDGTLVLVGAPRHWHRLRRERKRERCSWLLRTRCKQAAGCQPLSNAQRKPHHTHTTYCCVHVPSIESKKKSQGGGERQRQTAPQREINRTFLFYRAGCTQTTELDEQSLHETMLSELLERASGSGAGAKLDDREGWSTNLHEVRKEAGAHSTQSRKAASASASCDEQRQRVLKEKKHHSRYLFFGLVARVASLFDRGAGLCAHHMFRVSSSALQRPCRPCVSGASEKDTSRLMSRPLKPWLTPCAKV